MRSLPSRWVTLFVTGALLAPAVAPAGVHPVYAARALVVTGEPQATDVGVAILAAGGNAFDAAAAVGFALAVTYPLAGNLGGGGFCLAAPADGAPFALDFREVAPAGAHRDLFLDENGEVVPGMSAWSHHAVAVPGTVDGLLRLQRDHGVLSRKEILAPAISLAREGCVVSPLLHFALTTRRDRLEKYAETARIFLPDGEVPAMGARLVQEDLGRTLERIRKHGGDGFYAGAVAEDLISELARHGSVLSRADLAAYRSVLREPFSFPVEGLEILTFPLPSSGGVVLAQTFGLLDLEELRTVGWHSADYVRKITEALRLAYADRNHHLGDPAFAEVPVQELVSPAYLEERARQLPASGAGRSADVFPGTPRGAPVGASTLQDASGETTHYTVVDSDGNVVAITYTVNAWFGMGAVVPGAGFFLNNEMDDFSAKPGVPNLYGLLGTEANAIQPGKRPLSSMTPTIVRRDGEFVLTVGSPGGSRIITTVLQVILNSELFGMNIREAIDAPRFHHQWWPDHLEHEPFAFSPDTERKLRAMGYELSNRGEESIGRAMGIRRTPEGLTGWADRRSTGKAAGQP